MKQKSGFTLIELSIVIAIIGVILYGGMNILVVSVQTTQVNQTVATMDTIEKALLDYRVAFNRLPCPTDLTATITNANYAVEAANMGSCTGGLPAANFIAASGTAEGGVPTRALRLPDSFMYDGWGHRFRYAVNPAYTVASVSSPTNTAAITVNDASGAARSTHAIYAIISHGANGHGGYTSAGIVVNSGSTNADEQTNCHCDNTAAHTGGAGVLSPVTYVEKYPTIATAGSPLTSFDDIVTFKEGWQMMTPNLATNDFVPAPTYYRTVTIDHTKVGTVGNTDQTNFPVLFSGTYAYLATVANGGLVTNASGYDITFTSDAAGKTLLPFERESYNAATGAVTFWVQVPTVSHTADTVIYLQYGNSGITTDQSNKTGTWDSNYMGVWHQDETSGTQYDSTSNANHLNSQIQISQEGETTTSKFGGADYFNASGDGACTTGNLLPTNLTVQGWVNMTSFNGSGNGQVMIAQFKSTAPWQSYVLSINSSHYLCMTWYNTSSTTYQTCGSTALSTGTWYSILGTYNSSTNTVAVYLNGALVNSLSTTGTMIAGNSNFCPGTQNSPTNPHGYFDETRVSNTARSADWIKTEYNNENSPSTFYTVGAQTSR